VSDVSLGIEFLIFDFVADDVVELDDSNDDVVLVLITSFDQGLVFVGVDVGIFFFVLLSPVD
jgi:hypothetical protein